MASEIIAMTGKIQALFATLGRLGGLTPMMKKYTSKEDWEETLSQKDLNSIDYPDKWL